MYDPIGGFQRMIDQFMVYLDTAYRVGDADVAEARRVLLSTPGQLALDAIFEVVPRYTPWEKGLEELVDDHQLLRGFAPHQRRAFVELVLAGLFDSEPDATDLGVKGRYKPYCHQIEMLRRGIQDGKPGIITSGTGSGKTESFLLPVLAQIAKEATNWPEPIAPIDNNWLGPRKRFQLHRAGEHPDRPKAMRAIVLYPLNALVEDQMVRLRKAIDSPAAREVMERHFNGNRIFFGRYTGKSPVTGWREHPRRSGEPYWEKRSKRAVADLKKKLIGYRRIQEQIAAKEQDEELRYLFPATGGCELISRWDMQETPPDILVTNQSILNAMLVREIDAPIILQTRRWLESDPDARFFLVLDELHLVRGSAGAELASLLRILIDRLGLSKPQNAHKLRILCSSASLPIEEGSASASIQYLKNMFGAAGTAGVDDLDTAWRESIVPGTTEQTVLPAHQPSVESLHGIAEALERSVQAPLGLKEAIVHSARTIGSSQGRSEREALEVATQVAAGMLEFSTQDQSKGGKKGPVTVNDISVRLFGSIDRAAVRGLLALRAIPDLPRHILPEEAKPRKSAIASLPSFRMHAFVRNVEGLFSSISLNSEGNVSWGRPSIERGVDYDPDTPEPKRRMFELLYCEACGELFVGGKRGETQQGGRMVSLLPAPEELEKLPEVAISTRFEDASFGEFALFWPGREQQPLAELQDHPAYGWTPASLDPLTGLVTPAEHQDRVNGYYLNRLVAEDGHRRDRNARGTAVPYCCPKCGTDYSGRFRAPNSLRREGRLSPLRSFRTGFNKTSQLLATELVAALKAQGGDGKLVAFSDSREDAANLALEVEVQHQTDLRREILISAAERLAAKKQFTAEDAEAFARLSAEIRELSDSDRPEDQDAHDRKVIERRTLRTKQQAAAFSPSLPLSELFEFDRGQQGDNVRPIVNGLLQIGALPVKGADTPRNRVRRHPWYEFFVRSEGNCSWKADAPEPLNAHVGEARRRIFREQIPEATDLLFSKTYFALEETGLGWPSFYGPCEYGADHSRMDAWLRVFADAYRVVPNEFQTEVRKNWNDAADMLGGRRPNRLRKLLEELFVDPHAEANAFLSALDETLGQRSNGSIDVTKLFFRIAQPSDPAWRCPQCARVHLHYGFGKCTRCGRALEAATDLTCGMVSAGNFLGRRVVRSVEEGESLFRLRCEELTGQTEDPAKRLQQFKGVFVREEDESESDFALRRKFDEVDLISVTTTMEVGVDIGSLQAVYQGNMPPQRFNYQQRVGRAGRRGQAFSTVLTVCRSKSHDIHYFRNALEMTGSAPPPPFITTGLVDIPSRLLRKFWLVEAFSLLRARNDAAWPGDDIVPGDIHGEFLYCRDYFNPQADWPDQLRIALVDTLPQYEELCTLLAAGAECERGRLTAVVTVDSVLRDIEKLREEFGTQSIGIASALAEQGLIPMYGMPTRSRNLYVDLLWKGTAADRELDWDTIDRDQDLAIFDFAPGNVRTREKLHHRSIGFTGPLPIPKEYPPMNDAPMDPFSHWFKEYFLLNYCPNCGTWSRCDTECRCGFPLASEPIRCLTPTAYRTDFRPSEDVIASKVGQRIVLASFGHPVESMAVGNLEVKFAECSEVFVINPGPRLENSFEGFEITPSVDRHASTLPFPPRNLQLSGQAILTQVVADDPIRFSAVGGSENVWLASPKVTNSLQLGCARLNPRLRLQELDGGLLTGNRQPGRTSVRSAAISATELIVQRAAFELDIAPEEFDALAPCALPSPDGTVLPHLQIADSLPNGSGFCRHLLSDQSLPLTTLIGSILDDGTTWPRNTVDVGSHRDECSTSCYKCVQRYNNRNYHGLLDWRLGMSYLRSLRNPAHECGLDGDFSAFELQDWPTLAERAAYQSRTFVPGNRLRTVGAGLQLPAFSLNEASTIWAVIVHPLWKREGLMEVLGLQGAYVFVDTFELARRPLAAIQRARGEAR